VSEAAPRWVVYVLRSTVRVRTYVGITIDLDRRLAQHNGEQPGGASSTRVGRPWEVGVTYGPYLTRSQASKVERKVKALRGARRLTWVPADPTG
jgi:putative endonuclease